MNKDYSVLRDPDNGETITVQNELLVCKGRGSFPIVEGIPRFVDKKNYAEDFGLQWNLFRKTQLDSYTGTNLTKERLVRCLNGHLNNLEGKLVLEAGSGAGRFTEILLSSGAIVHSFDFSNAVEANRDNNGLNDNLTLVQADIRKIPFQREHYDCVICLGVLQHTPNPEQSIGYLYQMVRPGGYLVIDHYLFTWRNILPPPIGGAGGVYRTIMLTLPARARLNTIRKVVDFWFPIHWKFKDSLTAQRILRRLSPVHFYYPHLGLGSEQMYYEWALLDTHDGTTDFYKHHRSIAKIESHLERLGASEISVWKGGNGVEAFCRRPK